MHLHAENELQLFVSGPNSGCPVIIILQHLVTMVMSYVIIFYGQASE